LGVLTLVEGVPEMNLELPAAKLEVSGGEILKERTGKGGIEGLPTEILQQISLVIFLSIRLSLSDCSAKLFQYACRPTKGSGSEGWLGETWSRACGILMLRS
jgi:hypothetical protein